MFHLINLFPKLFNIYSQFYQRTPAHKLACLDLRSQVVCQVTSCPGSRGKDSFTKKQHNQICRKITYNCNNKLIFL